MELESTFPLQQVRALVRHISTSSGGTRSPSPKPASSRGTHSLFPNHPTLPAEQDKIRLRLTTWANVLAEPINTDDLVRARIDKILNFFINVAYSNNLSTTPAVQCLQDTLSVL